MIKHFQSFCKAIGGEACYALCLIDIAEEYSGNALSKIDALERGIRLGYIMFNEKNYNSPENFYVKLPDLFLKAFTGVPWTVRKEKASYALRPGEYGVEFWSQNGGQSGHFARTYKGFNSLQHSASVSYGSIHSWRVCVPEIPAQGRAA